jgi:hypothetical protein
VLHKPSITKVGLLCKDLRKAIDRFFSYQTLALHLPPAVRTLSLTVPEVPSVPSLTDIAAGSYHRNSVYQIGAIICVPSVEPGGLEAISQLLSKARATPMEPNYTTYSLFGSSQPPESY